MKSFHLHGMFWCIAVIQFLLFAGCSTERSDSDKFGADFDIKESPIEISWELLSNFEDDNQFRAHLSFYNRGDDTFPSKGWTLYLNSIRALNAESFLPEFDMIHINGDFFKLEPTDAFEPILPGESIQIEYLGSFFSIKKTDAPQGFYFVFDDGNVETVESVEVKPFETEEQVHRSPDDNLEVPTAERRYRQNEMLSELPADEVGRIIPKPVSLKYGAGTFKFTDGLTVTYDGDFSEEAAYLSMVLEKEFELETKSELLGGDWDGTGILLNIDPDASHNNESYRLQVTSDAIELYSPGRAGIFYAIESLRALLSNRNNEALELTTVEVEDYPAFGYRGMHLDVSRNFQSKESVLRLLELMGMYKLNKFHFHLTDDEGWRLAIDQFPELTEVGGRRGHTETEENYLIPAYGSGPDPAPRHSFGSGWYNREDYLEILQFASKRHIEVIPEIDVPGHARAAIKAMEARYDRLSEEGRSEDAEMYRLVDPEDKSEYMSVQNFNDNVINVCKESTYRFLGVVFDDIIAMHHEAGAPLNMIHVGGDEVPHGVWEESPACRKYMEEHELRNVDELPGHFFGKLQTMLEDRGLEMAGWEEVALMEGENMVSADPNYVESVLPYVWNSIWGSGNEDSAYKLANAGYNVVMSNASNLYFDMAYNKSWKEPGFYWAAMFNTKETFSFIPFNLFRNASHDNYGNPIDPERYADYVHLNETSRENIVGLQGQLWSETVNVAHRWEYMVLPRLLALSERAWAGNPSWGEIEDRFEMESARDLAWNEFANRIGRYEYNRLSRTFENINYRLPLPGALIENGLLKVNSSFPGLMIRYEVNGNEPGSQSPVYTEPVDISNTNSVKIAVFNSKGISGDSITIRAEDSH